MIETMGTVSKALSLLKYFSRNRVEIGLTEMTRLSGVNKATVYRLLGELQEQGFVEQTGSGREYRLGPVYLRLASLREAAVPMREVAHNVLVGLSDATGETTHMSVLQGNMLSVLSYAYSQRHGTRVTMEDAEVIPLHATSSGLAVLAYSASDIVDAVLSQPLPPKTAVTLTDPELIRKTLQTMRRVGFAESISGYEEDVHSHACPIFGAGQNCIGAIAVTAPVARMNDALQTKIKSEVKAAALDLTRLLGGFAPTEFKDIVEA